MKISAMMPSKYLKQSDIEEDGQVVTFKKFSSADVSQDQSGDMKWIAYFEELEKPLVMNVTNLKRAAKAFGTEETDNWIGKKITIYVDPDIEFGGEIVGGIRLKAAKGAAAKPKPTAEDDADDIAERQAAVRKARKPAKVAAGDEPDDEIPF